MTLTKRGKAAVKALLRGEGVSMNGWPRDEVLAVLDAALTELERMRERGLRSIAKMEALITELQGHVRDFEADIARVRELRAQVVGGQ
ncbi:hypothetical protein [Caldinitratiruptor microaerophilus]|uniref:Uncharacterized protein n=1 Tax=Caldinitratiruptor microaerophilus TaxID=671077 RepID=A0AA35CR91_9FIRM|nr:hypothetical protein [Caldinitratiruptor microaerophilus]BDG59638.1 hypothetical protein caldi_07280 [Caldinitratiruptor microaerophilus]BDG62335.1 hypothetical protein caldi_34250 [Caldinitratiruptor microaerophilus]